MGSTRTSDADVSEKSSLVDERKKKKGQADSYFHHERASHVLEMLCIS
jgi:hypothetical protein